MSLNIDDSIPKSPRRLVFMVLQQHLTQFLSVREILSYLFEHCHTQMSISTVVKVLDELKIYNGYIEERVERRGKYKIPIKVFSLTKNIDKCLD